MLTSYCVTIMKQFTSRHSGVAELSTGLTACLECLTMQEPMCLEENRAAQDDQAVTQLTSGGTLHRSLSATTTANGQLIHVV